jgi:hypothetical protein
MMNKKFAKPYIIYYPIISHDGMPFPVNCTVRDFQEEVNKGWHPPNDRLWRGNLIAAKFSDDHFTQMMDASMADFPILKNYLGTHLSPCSNSSMVQTTHSGVSLPSIHAFGTSSIVAQHPPPHRPAVRRMCFLEQQPQKQQHQHLGVIPQALTYEPEPSSHHHVHPHMQAHRDPHAHEDSKGMPIAPCHSPSCRY